MYFCFDTETSGLPSYRDASYRDVDAYSSCRMMSIAWYLLDENCNKLEKKYFVITPEFEKTCCCPRAEHVHGISHDFACSIGTPFDIMLAHLERALEKSNVIVGHNVCFDIYILKHELWRRGRQRALDALRDKKVFCTMKFACIKFGWPKYPKLIELHKFLFQKEFENAHNALSDVRACANCFISLTRT